MIEVKRGNTIVWAGNATGKQFRKVMQEDRCVINILSPNAIEFKLYDTVEVFGSIYKLNRPSNIAQRNDLIGYEYEIEFEALYYDLGKWELKTLDKNNQLTEGDVYLMANAATVLGLVVRNANRTSSGWSVGVVDDTEVMQYAYNNAKLLTVLQDLADKNRLEFWVDGKVINLTIRQPQTNIKLEHGKGKGLYRIEQQRTERTPINCLTILGGTRNLQTGKTGYGFAKLQPTGGNPISIPIVGDIVEETIEFANIYPRLIAKATAVPAANIIRSTDINFNLNAQLLNSGESAKITFTSGQLAGFTFAIDADGWDNSTKQINFNIIQDDPAYPSGIPNNVLKPSVGDSFVLLDINMPDAYKTAAEDKLKEIGDQYLADFSVTTYNWAGSLTPLYVLENNITVELGGIVQIIFGGKTYNVRISGFTRDIVEKYKYDITIDAVITIADIVRQANAQDRLSNSVSKGIGADGTANTRETIDTVARRGKITPLVLELGGSENSRVLGAPSAPPPIEDMKPGIPYIYVNHNAPPGEDPEPSVNGYLRDLLDVDVSGVVNGQALTYDVSKNKWVPATPLDLTGYARESWVLAQDYAPKSWVLGQNYITNGIRIDSGADISNGSDSRVNKVWFDYSWAGTGVAGSVISFGGFGGAYQNELFADYYGGSVIGVRSFNGDLNVWNAPRYLWHSGNLDPRVSVEGNSVVKRNEHGFIYANYYNMVDGGDDEIGIKSIMSVSADGFMRKNSKQAVNQFLGTPPNGDTLQSVMSRSNITSISAVYRGDSVGIIFDNPLGLTSGIAHQANGVNFWNINMGAGDGSANYNIYNYNTGTRVLSLNIDDNTATFSNKVKAAVMQPDALIIPKSTPANMEPGFVYLVART